MKTNTRFSENTKDLKSIDAIEKILSPLEGLQRNVTPAQSVEIFLTTDRVQCGFQSAQSFLHVLLHCDHRFT